MHFFVEKVKFNFGSYKFTCTILDKMKKLKSKLLKKKPFWCIMFTITMRKRLFADKLPMRKIVKAH